MSRVTVFVAEGCHLCEAALDVLRQVCVDGYTVVDISGNSELETRHRERIPVVEIDGVARFTYYVQPEALRTFLS